MCFMHVFIPVCGSKSKGQVRSNATVRNGKWELDKVVLELKDRPEYLHGELSVNVISVS